jgi:hypothetical protein
MQGGELVLRDIHQPPAPGWWPPAPGWWLLAAALLAVMLVLGAWWWRRRRRRRAIEALFDDAIAAAASPAAEVAAMSELLRRAARRRHPQAETLHGEAWLALLDREPAARGRGQAPAEAFSAGPGRLLLDGGYRRDTDPQAVAALRELARRRFLQWMTR